MATADLTAQRLREVFNYNKETGEFTWVSDFKMFYGGVRYKSGSTAGGPRKHGYIGISVDGKRYLAHVLAWLYVTGSFPYGDIDHIDGDPRNNRFENLRDVSRQVNIENRIRANNNNSSGFLGVSRAATKSERWVASIHSCGKKYHVGIYKTKEQAHQAYLEAKRLIHSGCTL
jgi:hypothetical protein